MFSLSNQLGKLTTFECLSPLQLDWIVYATSNKTIKQLVIFNLDLDVIYVLKFCLVMCSYYERDPCCLILKRVGNGYFLIVFSILKERTVMDYHLCNCNLQF